MHLKVACLPLAVLLVTPGCLSTLTGGPGEGADAFAPLVALLDGPLADRIDPENVTADPHANETEDGHPLLRSAPPLARTEKVLYGLVKDKPYHVAYARPFDGGVDAILGYRCDGGLHHQILGIGGKVEALHPYPMHAYQVPTFHHAGLFESHLRVAVEFDPHHEEDVRNPPKTSVAIKDVGREIWEGAWTRAVLTTAPDGALLIFLQAADGTVALAKVNLHDFGRSGTTTKFIYKGAWGKDWDTFLPFWRPYTHMGITVHLLLLLSYSSSTGRAALDGMAYDGKARSFEPVWTAEWSPGWKHFGRTNTHGPGLEYVAWNKDTNRVVIDRFNPSTWEFETIGEGRWTDTRPPLMPYTFPDVRAEDKGVGVFLLQRVVLTREGEDYSEFVAVRYTGR